MNPSAKRRLATALRRRRLAAGACCCLALGLCPRTGSTPATNAPPPETGAATDARPLASTPPAEASPAEPAEPDRAPSIAESVAELLQILQQRQMLPADADADARRKVLQAVVEAVDCSARVVSPEDGEASPQDAPDDAEALGKTTTVGGLFAYIQVLGVTAGAAADVSDFLGDVKYGHYEGLVVDLRDARGGNAEAAHNVAPVVAKTKLPVVVLVNGETQGPAEVLAALLRQNCDATTIGQPTRGRPFAWRPTPLKCGDVLLLPPVDGKTTGADRRPARIRPDLTVEQPKSGKDAQDKAASEAPDDPTTRDLCLRKAVDLLTAIRALEQKHF